MRFFLAASPLKRPDEKSQLQFSQTTEPNSQPAINNHSLNSRKHEHFTISPLTNYHPSLTKAKWVPITNCVPSSNWFWYPTLCLAAWVSSTDSQNLCLTDAALLLPGLCWRCPSLSTGCSAEVNPLLLWGCLFNSFSANLVYIKPIWSETGLFRDVVGLSVQQPAPSWEEADMQKSKNLQTISKDLLKIIWLSQYCQ